MPSDTNAANLNPNLTASSLQHARSPLYGGALNSVLEAARRSSPKVGAKVGAGDVAVLGAGAWGTALAIALARKSETKATGEVRLWARREAHVAAMRAAGVNEERLPGCAFPASLSATEDMSAALSGASVVLLAATSSGTEDVAVAAAEHAEPGAALILCAKGLAKDGGLLADAVARVWRGGPVLVLSGPSFADEVAQDLPTIVTLAGENAALYAARLSSARFVVCPSADLAGVQIAGVFKNVAATLCGAADGIGAGANARAALMSEAMREASGLIAALGGDIATLLGPAGFGDFALTCTDAKSRNYSFGRDLATGAHKSKLGKTHEGMANVATLLRLADEAGVDAPLAAAVADLVAGRVDAEGAIAAAFDWRRSRVRELARAA